MELLICRKIIVFQEQAQMPDEVAMKGMDIIEEAIAETEKELLS